MSPPELSGSGEIHQRPDGRARSPVLQGAAVRNGLRALELEVIARNEPCNWTYTDRVQGEAGSDGASKVYVFHTVPIPDLEGRVESLGTIGFALDGVPERVIAELAPTDRSNSREHDVLTGCLSRGAILGLLETEIAKARRSGAELSIASVDLDSFKGINDGMGHNIGDALLKALAARMRRAIGDKGLVGRLSGDEFLILLPDRGLNGARLLLDALLEDIRMPFKVEGTELIATCSVGVASFPRHADHGLDLVRASDLALYRSKDRGRDRISVFEPDMQVARDRTLRIINSLHRALAQEEFHLVYQPQFELSGVRRMIGVEALIRWDDAILGAVPPAEFIPLGHQCGLGLAIDLWVIKTCLAQKSLWETAEAELTVSFNTSASSFLSVGFARKILSLIELYRLNPRQIHIEVTETTLMQKATICTENLNALRAAGVGISIDDFGTGYSSLSLIHDLSPTEIKIDRSFVARIGEATPHATRPLELIMALAQSLDLPVVAEGIETEAQLNWLVAHGCGIGQGFLMSAPVASDAILPCRTQSKPSIVSSHHSVMSTWLTTAPNS
jgi:diguanylate cyclase